MYVGAMIDLNNDLFVVRESSLERIKNDKRIVLKIGAKYRNRFIVNSKLGVCVTVNR